MSNKIYEAVKFFEEFFPYLRIANLRDDYKDYWEYVPSNKNDAFYYYTITPNSFDIFMKHFVFTMRQISGFNEFMGYHEYYANATHGPELTERLRRPIYEWQPSKLSIDEKEIVIEEFLNYAHEFIKKNVDDSKFAKIQNMLVFLKIECSTFDLHDLEICLDKLKKLKGMVEKHPYEITSTIASLLSELDDYESSFSLESLKSVVHPEPYKQLEYLFYQVGETFRSILKRNIDFPGIEMLEEVKVLEQYIATLKNEISRIRTEYKKKENRWWLQRTILDNHCLANDLFPPNFAEEFIDNFIILNIPFARNLENGDYNVELLWEKNKDNLRELGITTKFICKFLEYLANDIEKLIQTLIINNKYNMSEDAANSNGLGNENGVYFSLLNTLIDSINNKQKSTIKKMEKKVS